jgi:hypothetical protein
LDSHSSQTVRNWSPVFAVVTVFSFAAMLGLFRAPELITFRQPAASQISMPASVASVAQPAQARLVPTSFEPGMMETPGAEKPKKSARRRTGSARMLEARMGSPRPMLLRAPASVEQQYASQMVVVFVQLRDAPPQPSWTVCVWRVTFVNHYSSEARLPAKSI